MSDTFAFFVTCPKGIEQILYDELAGLGARKRKQTHAGVHFKGGIETAYRVCLWSRLANRVLMPMAHFTAQTPDDLYDRVCSLIDWDDQMEIDGTLAVDFTADRSNRFHSHYAALRVKDAIVDQFKKRYGKRPSVDTYKPEIRVNVHMKRHEATLSLDLSGESLHKRGYRLEGGEAPLKENLAAAILIRAGWPAIARKGGTLIDPLCGSGTLLLEAALMALEIAPGLYRKDFGFLKWKYHDESIWQKLLDEATQRKIRGVEGKKVSFFGFDADKQVVLMAEKNASRAGLSEYIRLQCSDLDAIEAPALSESGLVIANPPYGKRMDDRKFQESLFRHLGERLKERFYRWHVSVFTANPNPVKQLGIRAKKQYKLFNGALACKLLNFEVHESWYVRKGSPAMILTEKRSGPVPDGGTEMFANRLKKNLKRIGKWAQSEGIMCYRLYDSDMPEYAVAIDLYNDRVHVQEYRPPGTVPDEDRKRRLKEIMTALPDVLKISPEKIVLKVRKRTKGRTQYNKYDDSGQFFEVRENNLRFLVNLLDYLDTGLFLDHRNTRQLIKRYASQKRFLNLFSYTGTASVYAAAGGARQTTSVDMSQSYVSWAGKNFKLNGFDNKHKHRLIRAECLEWISGCEEKYDLIFLDPPTFSNSKRMKESFDVQRDHVKLLRMVRRLLAPDGLIIFSSSRRKFRLDTEALTDWNIKDISLATIPMDFQRNKRIHHCFEIN